MKKLFLIFLFFGACSIPQTSHAQTPQPTSTPAPDSDEIKVTTTLVRVDVIVTDKKNRPVTNLKLDDFELYENGVKQEISDFLYVSPKSTSKSNLSTADSLGLRDDSGGLSLKEKIDIPTTEKPDDQNSIRRTLVIVVDNLGLSFASVGLVKKSLEKFIKEQIREGDLVSVVMTGSTSVLPAFTSNKKQLLANIKKIKWGAQSRGGSDYYEPIRPTLLDEISEARGMDIPGVRAEEGLLEDLEMERKSRSAVATIASLQYIIRGMGNLPGRKAVVLFSEGFSLSESPLRNSPSSTDESGGKILRPAATNRLGSGASDALTTLIEAANQYSIVIYPIDPRGLEYVGMAFAQDDVRRAFNRDFKPGQTDDKMTGRDREFRNSQDGLRVLASETGGFAILNKNDLDEGLERIIDDQSYYLLGFITNQEDIETPKDVFENLEIRIKNPDLNVRYRTAFYSEDSKRTSNGPPQTSREKVGQALAFPFKSNEIKLNLYSITGSYSQGEFIRFLINISAEDLEFKRQSNGMRTANIDMLAITLNEKEEPVDQFSRNFNISVNEQTYKNLLKNGVVYVLPVSLKKSGTYHFRVAIHDSITGRVGAAAKVLETPKFEKKRLWISNLTLKASANNEAVKTNDENDKSIFTHTTLRQFSTPIVLNFGAVVYNAKTNEASLPELAVKTRLIKDGKVVTESSFEPVATGDQSDLMRIDLTGRIKLEKNLSTGNYIFQVIVLDKLAKKDSQIVTQWVDFEVENK